MEKLMKPLDECKGFHISISSSRGRVLRYAKCEWPTCNGPKPVFLVVRLAQSGQLLLLEVGGAVPLALCQAHDG